ncbi:MAG: oligosaccharide flippase family protein [Solirubrobacterales bacterium]
MTKETGQNFNSIKGHMARGAIWMVAMRWSLRGVGLINTVIIARLLAPEDFGVSAMAWIVVEFLMTLTETNVDLALLRSQKFDRARMDTAWTVKVLAGLLTTVGLLAVAPVAAAYYHDPRITVVIAIVASRAAIMGFENIGVVEFRQNLEFSKEYRYWVWRRVIMLGVGLGLAFIFRNYLALAIAAPLAGVVTVIVSFVMSSYRPRWCLTHWREMWSFSQWLIIYSSARFVSSRADQFVLGGLAGASATGAYYVASSIATVPGREIIWPMGRAFTPTLARIVDDEAEMLKALKGILAIVALIALPAGVGLAMVAEDATLVLLGEQWRQSVDFFRWLAICGALEGFFLAMESYFIARSRERGYAFFNMAQVALLVPFVVLAGHFLGTDWIAPARGLAMAVMVVAMFGFMARMRWLTMTDALSACWRPLLASGVMAAAVYLLHQPEISIRFLSLALDIGVGLVAFALALTALWLIAGRPDGVERSILTAVSDYLAYRRSREPQP